eukprot:187485_1
MLLAKCQCLIRFHSSQVSQIRLISDEHYDNIGLSMISQLLQPTLDILKGGVLANVINEEGTNCSAVVGGCDSAITFLSGGIPDLGLDGFSLCLDGFGGEFDANCGFGFEVKFVTGEAGKKV